MRYLSTRPLELPKPMQRRESKDGETDTQPDMAAVFKVLLESYQPTQRFNLSLKQLRSLNKCLDVFEGEAEEGYFVVDNDEWELLKLMVEQYAPVALVSHARDIPAIYDSLLACPEKRPAAAISEEERKIAALVD